MHVQDPESGQFQDLTRQAPVEPKHEQEVRSVPGKHLSDRAWAARQEQIHARGNVLEYRFGRL
jgi:hypothetical protein